MRILALFLIMGTLSAFRAGPGIPDRLMEKLRASVSGSFPGSATDLQPVPVPSETNARTPSEFGEGRLFEIRGQAELLGYAYLGEAPSMKQVFDYVVILEPDLQIRKVKILIYREHHGRQIGSQRWLRQFIGLGPGSLPVYGSDVDAISGATISARSMTLAVRDLLESLRTLRAEELLP